MDGIRGSVGAPLSFRQQTWSLICRVVRFEHCTKHILQKLLGYVCFIFQYRRELYALQHHIYKFVNSMPSKGRRQIPFFILDELRSIGLHLAFSFWDMRRQLSQSLLSTDATPTSGGAARAPINHSVAEELWKRSEVRGESVRLDQTELLDVLANWEEPKEPSAWASVLGRSLEWNATSSYTFRQTSHINLQEGRALKNEVKKLAMDSSAWGIAFSCVSMIQE